MFHIIRCPWKSRDVTIHGVAVNSNLGRHFESPAVMGRPRFRPLRASSWLFSVVNNQAVNSNVGIPIGGNDRRLGLYLSRLLWYNPVFNT